MLHIQDSYVHTSNLLMTPPMTVIIQPQSSTSSRSNKVIEQLANKMDSVHRDLAATRLQLETIRQAKLKHEKETMNYTNSNKIYRSRIKQIMQVLESKQKVLESTKGSSSQLESKVKQLKDEALASRKQLEDLRRRAQVLERDRDIAVKERNQIKQKQILLQDSIQQLRVRYEREIALLQTDYSIIVNQSKRITEKNEHMLEVITLKVNQRKKLLENITIMKGKLGSNAQNFIDQVKGQLEALIAEIQETASQTRDCTLASIECRSEVNGLVTRIKTIAAEITASEERSQAN